MSKIIGKQRILPVTNWTTFTPVIDGVGTITNATGRYRRVGDTMEIWVFFVSGTNNGSNIALNMPTGFTIDSAKTGGNGLMVGHAVRGDQTGMLHVDNTVTTNKIFLGKYSTGTTANLTKQSNTYNSGDQISFVVDGVPISGWSAQDVLTNP